MAVRNLTIQEHNQLKDGVVTDLIMEHEHSIQIVGREKTHKVVHAFPFYQDGQSFVSLYVVEEDAVCRYTWLIYFSGCTLCHAGFLSLTGPLRLSGAF